jgi:hypothetical protein
LQLGRCCLEAGNVGRPDRLSRRSTASVPSTMLQAPRCGLISRSGFPATFETLKRDGHQIQSFERLTYAHRSHRAAPKTDARGDLRPGTQKAACVAARQSSPGNVVECSLVQYGTLEKPLNFRAKPDRPGPVSRNTLTERMCQLVHASCACQEFSFLLGANRP